MMFPEHFKKSLEKLQNLSEIQKKIILWVVVVILAIAMGSIWVKTSRERFEKMKVPNFDSIINQNK